MPGSCALLSKTVCPHCWTAFAPEDVLWISAHADLMGDPVLGLDQQQRFLPSRFTIDGQALDARGQVCHALACPRCHLPVARALLEMLPEFVSILGTPSCGKSYFLAAMVWELRRLFPLHFALSFADADPVANQVLNEYEATLFLNEKADQPVPLANLIRKTEEQGHLYNTVLYGGQTARYPRPFLFTLAAQERHPQSKALRHAGRVLCLYDNAGESFAAGKDSPANPVTQHLAQSRVLLYLFDPLQDYRFRALCLQRGVAGAVLEGHRTFRQETVLVEAAARVRRYANLPAQEKLPCTLVVVLTKADVWLPVVADVDLEDPWQLVQGLAALDTERIDQRSEALRGLLLSVCPEVVAAAEGFAANVTYMPVSALGVTPRRAAAGAPLTVRPGDIRPRGVAAPLVYGLQRRVRRLIARLRRKTKSSAEVALK